MIGIGNKIFNSTLTWAILSLSASTPLFHRGKDDWPSGSIADHILEAGFMEKPKNLRKVCRFIWTDKTGSYNPLNGTYDGAIGLLAESKAEVYIIPLDFTAIPDHVVQPTSMVQSVNYILIHKINDKPRSIQGLASLAELLLPPLGFLVAALVGILLHLVCLGLFSIGRLAKRFRGLKKAHLQIKILGFFFMLFYFFMDQFYNGNLSTESITVDVSDLLYSEEQLLRTDKEPCLMDRDGELAIFKNAHPSTLAYKIYLKMKASDNPCFLLDGQSQLGGLMAQKNQDKVFTLGLDVAAAFLPKIIQIYTRADTFTNVNPVWQSLRALITSNSFKRERKRYFDRAFTIYNELGLYQKGFRDFPFNKYMGLSLNEKDGRDMYNNFFNLQSYIAAHSKIAPLSFLDLDYLFRIYLLILVSLFAFNMAHLALVLLSSNVVRLTGFIRRLSNLLAFSF